MSEVNSLELLHEGAVVCKVLPETLEDSADMVPYSEFVIELTSGAGMLDICTEETVFQVKKENKDCNLTVKHKYVRISCTKTRNYFIILSRYNLHCIQFTTTSAQNYRMNKTHQCRTS